MGFAVRRGIEAFMRNDVLTYTPDAIVSEDNTQGRLCKNGRTDENRI
jgi:hypothetical protein